MTWVLEKETAIIYNILIIAIGGVFVKNFFNKYSYNIIMMMVNQFVISIFGAGLAMATMTTENDTLTAVVSVFAILFYLFLLYNMTWEIGAKDRISVDSGKKPYRPHTGLVMALVANVPNFILAIVYSIAYPFMSSNKGAGTTTAVCRVISLFIQGMYYGVISVIKMFDSYLRTYWWTYFIIIIPAVATCWVAYYVGHKNFKFTSLFTNNPTPNGKK